MTLYRLPDGRLIRVNPTPVQFAKHLHLKKGGLTQYGWDEKKEPEERHEALSKCVRAEGKGVCFHRLLFLRNVANKSNNRMMKIVAADDVAWIGKHY